MKFFLYGNGGGIDKVKEELKNPKETFSTLKEAFEEIVRRYSGFLDIRDLHIQYYYYDSRIEKEVFIVTTSRYGNEDYIKKCGCPQFVSYMVTV